MAKAKGTILLPAVKYLRSRRQEALALLPPELHHYLEKRILEVSWYPESDLLTLIRVMIELLPGTMEEIVKLIGEAAAQEHSEGIYSHLLEGGPTPAGGFALWSSMHDSGRLRATREGDTSICIDLIDYGYPSPEMCLMVEAYILRSLSMGGVIPTAEKICCQRDGGDRCSWRCTWDPPE
jgi:hypothetical protein